MVFFSKQSQQIIVFGRVNMLIVKQNNVLRCVATYFVEYENEF
jgi:hypothetical protein